MLIVKECLKCKTGERIDVFSLMKMLFSFLLVIATDTKGKKHDFLAYEPSRYKINLHTFWKDISLILIGLLVVTSCDTTGKVHKKGKSTCFKKLLESNTNVITALKTLSSQDPAETTLSVIEVYFCVIVLCRNKDNHSGTSKIVSISEKQR